MWGGREGSVELETENEMRGLGERRMRMRKEFGFWWFLSSTLLGSISICWFNKKSVTGTYQLFILDSFKG